MYLIFKNMKKITLNIPSDLAPGCYTFCVYDSTTFERLYCSICINVGAWCDTLLFRYRNNEDAFGFQYAGNSFFNQIRLPISLRKMQIIGKRTVFEKSNGISIKLAETLQQVYELDVEYMNKYQHEQLAIMLAHDTIEFFDESTTSWKGLVSTGDYKINWTNQPNWGYAPGSGTVKITPYYEKNTNCINP